MQIPLLALQAILSLIFGYTGVSKLVYDHSKLSAVGFKGLDSISLAFVRVIGALELVGAVGLVVSTLLPSASNLSVASAGILGCIMIGATLHNIRTRERQSTYTTLVLFSVCLGIVLLQVVVFA